MKLILSAGLLFLAAQISICSASDLPEVQATRIERLPVWNKIFDDPHWRQPGVTRLGLQPPSNVRFPSPPESTQVRLLWNPELLLVRFDCHDRSIVNLPGADAAKRVRDLPYYKADVVEVFLDPVGDGRTYMEFEVSPRNGVFDAIYFCTAPLHSQDDFRLKDDVVNRDLFILPEWNLPGLGTAARIWPPSEGAGWSAVFAFPAKDILQRLGQKRFLPGMKFKANLVRFDYSADPAHKMENTNWTPVLEGSAYVSPKAMGAIVLAP